MPEPQVMHALKTIPEHPLVDGAIYETLCGIPWEHRSLTMAEQRTRFVCAMCTGKAFDELRDVLNGLIEKHNVLQAAYAAHLAEEHLAKTIIQP